MPPKRQASVHHPSQTSILSKAASPTGNNFSGAVRKNQATSTRTGQACDRCKTRKIRCDARAGGCSPCLSNKTECKTTDRITGRATSRGHIDAVEQECSYLRQTVADLQQQLRENGLEPGIPNNYVAVSANWSQGTPGADTPFPLWANAGFLSRKRRASSTKGADLDAHQGFPAFREGLIGDTYLGISAGNSYLSQIKGTSLSVFGMEIDLADFLPDDLDDQTSPTSFKTFLDHAMNWNNVKVKAELPPYEECQRFAGYYFRGLHPYLPVLHEAIFMDMLHRMYHDASFRPSAAQTVMVHMVIAIIKFQYVLRNSDGSPGFVAMGEQATAHYLYSLGYIHDLMTNHSLEDIQALALTCIHMRSFHKPAAAMFLTDAALAYAIDLGMHRSSDAWADTAPKISRLDVEIRKRVFWCILSIHVTLSGKLGRPMPLREEDFDVELPEPLDDQFPSATIPKDERRCSFSIAIETFKIMRIYMRMYSSIYAIRPPMRYDIALRQLEAQVEDWRDQLPLHLSPKGCSIGVQEERVQALMVVEFELELQLLLHHPSICKSSTPEVTSRNLDICLDTARKMIRNVEQIHQFKCLDITWYHCTLYLGFIFTTLFAYWERKDQLASSDLASLKADMDSWLRIMGDVGMLLGTKTRRYISPYLANLVEGSDKRLQDRLRVIIDSSMNQLNRYLVTKTASAAVASANLNRTPSPLPVRGMPQGQHQYGSANGYAVPYQETCGTAPNLNGQSSSIYVAPEDPAVAPLPNTYPPPGQYSYPNPSIPATPAYANNNHSFDKYESASYGAQPRGSHSQSITSQAHPQQQSADTFMFGNTANIQSPTYGGLYGSLQAWKHWTATMKGNLGPQDYLTSANALIALGGRDVISQADEPRGGAHIADMTGGMSGNVAEAHSSGAGSGGMGSGGMGSGNIWPLMVFDAAMGTSVQQ